MPLKLKTIEIDGKKYAELEGEHPAYENDDGKVIGFDANHANGKITSLNGEAQGHREKFEAAEARLKEFEGIEDPAKARAALDTVSALNADELVKAGKVEEIKAAAIEATKKQMEAALAAKDKEIETITSERDGLGNALNNELIGGNFGRSQFIKEKLTLDPSVAQAAFAPNFKVEDGKPVGYDSNGAKIYSPSKAGEIASFDEALEVLINSHPARDTMLKGRGQSGGGSEGDGGGGGGKGTMARAEFNKLDHTSQRAAIKDGVKVVDAPAA